jgi:MFS family permease
MAAIGWLVYRLTGKEFDLGLVAFCTQIPVFFGSLLGGIFADRWPRRRIIIITQTLMMCQAFILAVLIALDRITMTQIILLSLFQGVINAFDMPTRQAFVPEMVDDDDDLPNAIALNSMIFNLARQIGPIVAGFLIARVGEAACFFANSATFLAVIFSLLAMRQTRTAAVRHNGPIFAGIKEGLSYSFGFMPIRYIMFYTTAMSLVAMPYSVLMPVFAKTILHGGPQTYGALLWSTGIGAFVGAVILARRKTVRGLDTFIIFSGTIFALGIIGFSLSTNFWLSLVLVALPGFAVMVQMASVNTILQTIVDDDKRGRVLSLHVMAFIGVMPVGHLLAGTAAQHFGAQNTLTASGLLSIIVIILFARKLPAIRSLINPIYVKKGIIPELAAGIDTAARLSAQTRN